VKELEFYYLSCTLGLEAGLHCHAYYEETDESFDAHGASGDLETQARTGIEINRVEVRQGGEVLDPESLEPGLTQWIEKEALERIQDLKL